nr:Ubiquitin carboxyl terminal hydrolase 48 [Hymenolepis microstoma]
MSKKLERRFWCLSALISPDEVTESHIYEIYKLGKDACDLGACRSMCETNIRCLNGLYKAEKRNDNQLEPSHHAEGNKSPYLGLRNLGNTCYLNIFLQLYYHMPEFRRLVYEFDVKDDTRQAIFRDLKLIFSQLQLSSEGSVDPSNIAATLDLVPTVQQDAPEFHSLFLSLLGEHCSNIPGLFKGFDAYETRCKNCNYLSRSYSRYIELEVMPSEVNLENALKNMLKEEALEGTNKYSCSNCDGKRDGSRRRRIISTPKYINFHLMRFRMREDMSREKITNRFRFPDFLDMAPFVSSDVPSNEKEVTKQNLKYVCFCIVLHIGSQATAGHYICLIRCHEGQKTVWKVCNDECVFTIPDENFNVSLFCTSITSLSTYTSRLQNVASKVKTKERGTVGRRNARRRKSAGDVDSEEEDDETATPVVNGYHSSTTAYLIIYRRMEEGEEKGHYGAAKWEIKVPGDLRQEVEEIDYNKREKKAKEREITLIRPIWRTRLFDLLQASTSPKRLKLAPNDNFASLSDICIVPTKWLKTWFLNPDTLPPQLIYSNGGKIFPLAGDATFQLKPFLCRHNHISPTNSLESIRAISPHQLELALRCSKSGTYLDVPKEPIKGFSHLSREALDILSPCVQCIRHRVTDNRFTEVCDKIAKEMRDWKKISKDGTYPFDGSVCDSSTTSCEHPLVYFVGTKSLATWRSLAQTHYFKALETTEPVPTEFNKDAVCPHGELMMESCRIVSPSIWHRLRSLFNPPFSGFSTEIKEYPSTSFKGTTCLECCHTLSNLKLKAMYEIKKMSSILDASDYMPADRDLGELIRDFGRNEDKAAIYLLPTEFIRQWRRFCKATKVNDAIAFLPSGFECPNIRCEHDRLRMPWKELIGENFAFPLSFREWDLMSQAYPLANTYPPMRLVSTSPPSEDSKTFELQFDPPNAFFQVCESCYEEIELDRLNFKNARLYIRLCDNPETAINLDVEEMRSKERASMTDRPRRSLKKREDICVVVNGSMTLLKLRSMLIEHFKAYPMDQHLLINGVELTDNQKSLYQLGIRPDMLIFAWVDASTAPVDLEYEFPDGDVPPGGSTTGKEVGFAGTRLTNF